VKRDEWGLTPCSRRRGHRSVASEPDGGDRRSPATEAPLWHAADARERSRRTGPSGASGALGPARPGNVGADPGPGSIGVSPGPGPRRRHTSVLGPAPRAHAHTTHAHAHTYPDPSLACTAPPSPHFAPVMDRGIAPPLPTLHLPSLILADITVASPHTTRGGVGRRVGSRSPSRTAEWERDDSARPAGWIASSLVRPAGEATRCG
jgi:hypothetical protein